LASFPLDSIVQWQEQKSHATLGTIVVIQYEISNDMRTRAQRKEAEKKKKKAEEERRNQLIKEGKDPGAVPAGGEANGEAAGAEKAGKAEGAEGAEGASAAGADEGAKAPATEEEEPEPETGLVALKGREEVLSQFIKGLAATVNEMVNALKNNVEIPDADKTVVPRTAAERTPTKGGKRRGGTPGRSPRKAQQHPEQIAGETIEQMVERLAAQRVKELEASRAKEQEAKRAAEAEEEAAGTWTPTGSESGLAEGLDEKEGMETVQASRALTRFRSAAKSAAKAIEKAAEEAEASPSAAGGSEAGSAGGHAPKDAGREDGEEDALARTPKSELLAAIRELRKPGGLGGEQEVLLNSMQQQLLLSQQQLALLQYAFPQGTHLRATAAGPYFGPGFVGGPGNGSPVGDAFRPVSPSPMSGYGAAVSPSPAHQGQLVPQKPPMGDPELHKEVLRMQGLQKATKALVAKRDLELIAAKDKIALLQLELKKRDDRIAHLGRSLVEATSLSASQETATARFASMQSPAAASSSGVSLNQRFLGVSPRSAYSHGSLVLPGKESSRQAPMSQRAEAPLTPLDVARAERFVYESKHLGGSQRQTNGGIYS